MPRAIGFALLCILAFNTFAHAERPPLKKYTTADGLPHDSVNKIVRDSRGFLWFCTAEGLSRFDGYRFKNYTQDNGLPHRNVNDLLETKSGVYLVATSAGLSVFNPRGKSYRWNVIESRLERNANDPPLFSTFVPPAHARRFSGGVTSLAQDNQGRIWVGTGAGLFLVEGTGEQWTFHEFELEPNRSLPVTSLLAEPTGGVLVGSSDGLFHLSPTGEVKKLLSDLIGQTYLDQKNRLWVDAVFALKLYSFSDQGLTLLHTYTTSDGLPPNVTHFRVHQVPDGRIYVGFEYGFAEVLPDAKPNEPKLRIFEREKINAFTQDESGAVWIATDTKGAWKLAPTGFTVFGAEDGLSPNDEIMSVLPDGQEGIYVASRPNKLAHFSDRHFQSIVPFGLKDRSWGWHFLDFASHTGDWFVPGIDGLRHYPKPTSFADLQHTPPVRVYTASDGLFASEVFAQFEDSRGDVWFSVIGTVQDTLLRWDRSTGRIVRYTTSDGLPSGNGPISFAEDRQGNVWFGYYFGALARYRDGKFRVFTEADGLPGSQVSDLLLDSRGRLWVATSGRGLFRIDDTLADSPQFHGFSTANGLSSNQLICLTEDRFGRVYVGTGRGINRIDNDGSVRIFTQDDGLPSSQVSRCAADRRGGLWFVASNTLLRFVPAPERPASPPHVLIDRVLVNGKPQDLSELGEAEPAPLELTSAQRQIQVDYFALASGATENIHYQYQLDGQAWSQSIGQRTLTLDLAPGQRVLSIRSVDASGVPSLKPASIAFHILPPLWLRWWFIGLVGTAMAASLTLFYRYRVARLSEVNAALTEARVAEEALSRLREERLRELERVRARIATDLHDDIGSSLTQITVLSEVAHQQARSVDENSALPIERIITISNELVDTMSDIVWAINPRRDHLSDLLQRMRRFASDILTARQIAFTFHTPQDESDVALGASIRREVFLIYKECLNNVVRHSSCTKVEIDLNINEPWLVLSVRDNGKGFDARRQPSSDSPPTRGGNGLLNMGKRAKEMGGSFEVTSTPGEGTNISLRVSLAAENKALTTRVGGA